MEDNPNVRTVAATALRDAGHAVTEAIDGPAALREMERAAFPFDLLFPDVVLPGGYSGYTLAELARQRAPHLAVLFASGYPEAAASKRGDDTLGRTLKKPYRLRALRNAVDAALDGPKAPAADRAVISPDP